MTATIEIPNWIITAAAYSAALFMPAVYVSIFGGAVWLLAYVMVSQVNVPSLFWGYVCAIRYNFRRNGDVSDAQVWAFMFLLRDIEARVPGFMKELHEELTLEIRKRARKENA